MSEPFVGDYLNKLLLLEDKVGAKVGYQSFEPHLRLGLHFDPSNPVTLNLVARDMAHFVGIQDLVTVAITAHPKECAGHIDLGDTNDGVFIEIASDLLDFPQCVLATLAHELSHLFLHSHRISCGSGPEFHYHNEVLTDITAVFLGLGKLMLNGCAGERISRTPSQVVTHSRTVGYLKPGQLTLVYLLVCAMRGIPSVDYERWLVPIAIDRVRECRDKYNRHFFDANFHKDTIGDEFQAQIDRAASECTNKLNTLESEMRQLEQGYLSRTSLFLRNSRGKVAALRPPAKPNSHDPAMKFLLAVTASLESSQSVSDLSSCLQDADKYTQKVSDLLSVADGRATIVPNAINSWKSWFRRRRKHKA